MPRRDTRRLIGVLALLLGGLAAGLVSAEAVLRLVGVVSTVVSPHPDPALGYTLKPGMRARIEGVEHAYNSRGLRDREYPDYPAPGEVRILAMGDSVTYAQPIALERTYTKRLEERLGARHPERRFQVLNNGASRYNACQLEALFRSVGAGYHPHVVLWQWCLNDVEAPGDPFNADLHGVLPLPMGAKRWLRDHSVLWNVLRIRSYGLLRAAGVVRPDPAPEAYAQEMLAMYEPGRDAPFEAAWNCFLRGRQAIESNGARVLLLVVPFAYQAAGDPEFAVRPQERIRERCEAAGIPCLDLLDAVRRGGAWDLYLPGDFLHFNDAGHDVAARAILDAIEPLLPARRDAD